MRLILCYITRRLATMKASGLFMHESCLIVRSLLHKCVGRNFPTRIGLQMETRHFKILSRPVCIFLEGRQGCLIGKPLKPIDFVSRVVMKTIGRFGPSFALSLRHPACRSSKTWIRSNFWLETKRWSRWLRKNSLNGIPSALRGSASHFIEDGLCAIVIRCEVAKI